MTITEAGVASSPARLAAELELALDERTREILERRRRLGSFRRRGWLVRRALVAADVAGLSLAFATAQLLFGGAGGADDRFAPLTELGLFLLTLPVWVVTAKLYGLYDRDEERADHSTADDLSGMFTVVTVAAWVFFAGSWVTGLASPQLDKVVGFWGLSIAFVPAARTAARAACRRRIEYLQNTIVVGGGDVGQLVVRKLLQHPEYGLNVVGVVDSNPKERRPDLGHVAIVGELDQLPDLVRTFDVERVIVAFSNESAEDLVEVVRSLRDANVQIDVVPRLFDVVGPSVTVHAVEGLPLVGLPPVRLPRSSMLIKRTFDVVVASVALLVTAPLFALVAILIRRDSPGPVFFRQERLGMNGERFDVLKFRTMRHGTKSDTHEAYIASTMSAKATPEEHGLYKLERPEVTKVGRWLRRTSLDELPQLINVLRGEMSLVGPRPCLDYETAYFEPYHFDRFAVPAGITGLWQVTARAHSTFGEALDLDVLYARSWSLGLDLRMLLRTPIALLRQRKGTA